MTLRKNGLNANRWRRTHQQTVNSVLGAETKNGTKNLDHRTVRSAGTRFFNQDHWTLRKFSVALCEWAKRNPGACPSRDDVDNWVRMANRRDYVNPSITIANTPDELPRWIALALVGGGYHEAWHTEYSRRDYLVVDEVWPQINALWPLADWSVMTGPLLSWSNIVEDIYIERAGCRKYIGSGDKMVSLQDLILKMESDNRDGAEAAGHKALPANEALAAVTGAFRDLGLGYGSIRQRAALESYKATSPEGWDLVTTGAMAPLVQASIDLADDNPGKMGSLWIAMKVLAILGAPPAPPEGPTGPPGTEGGGGGGGGEGQEGQEGGSEESPPKAYSVGDRAEIKEGALKGREVEVTWAGVQCTVSGEQELRYALVELSS